MEAIYKCSSKYSFDEHMRFEQHAFHSSGQAKKVARTSLILGLCAVLSIVLLNIFDLLNTTTFFVPVVLVAFAMLYASVNGNLGRKLAWKMNPAVHDAQQKYFFFADHIEYHFNESKVDIPYEVIHAVDETASNIYIMLSPRQGMSILKRNAPLNLLPFLQDRVNETQKA